MKIFWGLITAAVLFLVLGTGNLMVGTSRSLHYQKLLSSIPSVSQSDAQDLATKSEGGKESEFSRQYARLQQRYEYYRFCIIGGKYFLAFSGCLFLAGLLAAHFQLNARAYLNTEEKLKTEAPSTSP